MHRLWRIDPAPPGSADLRRLAAGLRLHLRYTPLTTTLVQIGTRQQAYLTSAGCEGCARRRCTPACRMQLLRRMLIADGVAEDVRPVPLGLAPRPYARLVLAVPGPRARPLDGELLRPWHEARLWASWRMLLGRRVVGAALAVGADGPEPAEALRAHGWYTLPIPWAAGRFLTAASQPADLPFGWLAHPAPLLLLPRLPGDSGHIHASGPIVTPPPADGTHAPAALDGPVEIPLHWGGQARGWLTAALIAQALTRLAAIEAELQAPQVIRTPAPEPEHATAPERREPDPASRLTNEAPSQRSRLRRRVWTAGPAPAPEHGGVTPTGGADELVAAATGVLELSAMPGSNPAAMAASGTVDPEETGVADELGQPGSRAVMAPGQPVESRSIQEPALPAVLVWPDGPAGFSAAEIARLLAAMVTEPRLTSGRAGQVGLAVARLRAIYGIEAPEARALLCWFELAGLLAAPVRPAQPWGNPRPLQTTDLTTIAARLAATPAPSSAAIAACFAQG